ncbi:MAG TPA: CehA/McbA family metallohydrolase [Bryobacteraceae bacterium]|nr:CehA/McbA family metallohydrolase [Bryobacteraceae bacterium]
MDSKAGWNRRRLLQAVGASVPTLKLVGVAASAAQGDGAKFTPIDLSPYFNASSAEFGPRGMGRQTGAPGARGDVLIRPPGGKQELQGIPFLLGPEDVQQKSWIAVSTAGQPWAAPKIEIPIGHTAPCLCLAQFCDWDPNEIDQSSFESIEHLGQKLAEATLVYEDGSEFSAPIRRRLEVHAPSISFGYQCFLAMPSSTWEPAKLTDPLPNGLGWGNLQTVAKGKSPGQAPLWIWALENPNPDRKVKALRVRAVAEDPVVLCGLTLFHGREHPLRRERRTLYRITLPSPTAEEKGRWTVEVDLGVVVRTYVLPEFDPESWLRADGAGFGERSAEPSQSRHLYAEIAASADATLEVRDTASGGRYQFDLIRAVPGQELEARRGSSRIEILEREKTWIHGQVVDSATGRPTPVRLAFRSKAGRYIPPYGHRTEINGGWFQDYAADAKISSNSYAYVDGTFQAELPVGELYVEISKGFEYKAIREKLEIQPSQRELKLQIGKHADLRSKGWVTADTHVHFLSPSTAVLEAQAEGLNLVNLLAAQWGDLYTNVGDLPFGPLTSPDKETVVWVGTENRQHLLGHIGLLGGRGEPVFPMSADNPSEAFIGDPLWSSMAEWADACRKREGVVVAVHFPNPFAELAADIVLGKIDAVELYPQGDGGFRTRGYNDWYRYLNCGYRVTAAGGTDKMGTYTPVGGNRTYAYIGQEQFDFSSWAKAVRAGRTFASSGPLLLFQADGRMPGGEIPMRKGEAAVEVSVEANSHVPFHRIEIVHNGRVVASREEKAGTKRMAFSESVKVQAPGWLTARCSSTLGPSLSARFGIAAHTSPVYLSVAGEEQFSEPALTYLLTLVEGTRGYVEKLATRPDTESFARVLKVFADAREHLHRRLHEQGR